MIYLGQIILSAIFVGCGTAEEKVSTSQKETAVAGTIKLEDVWSARFVDESLLAPFGANPGWQSYYTRDFRQAMGVFEGDALARMHLEYSGIYRQALLMHSNATIFAYSEYKSQYDPEQTRYMLGVASIFLGKYKEADGYFQNIPADPQIDQRLEEWKAWLATDKKKEPQLKDFFFSAEGASVNKEPRVELVEYSFKKDEHELTATEGTALWLRARWHEEQAEQLLQKKSYGKVLVAHILDPWRLPFEKSFVATNTDPLPELSDNWFFFGFYLHTPDINFVGSIKEPYKALDTWKNKSILANYLQSCVKEKKLDPECVIDQASLLENRIREINKNETKDREEEVNSELLYEVFPVFARYSLLRVGALWAQENDQHRDSGRLRLIVREASGPIRDPLFLLAFAAWEAGNKSTLRAQDIVHEFSSEFSSLQSARIPLDSLHIRRGRDSVQDGPSH